MARMLDPIKLVQLPTLDALAAQTLGSAVLAAADHRTLPDPIAAALAELKVAVDALEATATQRLSSSDPETRTADRNLATAWGVLYGLLGSWSRLPDHPHAALARTVREQLFPDGLRFTHLPFRLAWGESKDRLRMIDEGGLARQIEQLGASVAVAQIREAHARYGDVVALTTGQTEPDSSVGAARAAVIKALRLYVLHVSTSIRCQDPASADLARALLAPITTWRSTAPPKAAA